MCWRGGGKEGGGGRPHPRKRLGLGLRVAAAGTTRDVVEGWWLSAGLREGWWLGRRQGRECGVANLKILLEKNIPFYRSVV